ncbi:MAG TPA: DUF4391 domain-containing protein [Candidatus Coprovicinus avistercoris]|uniref:DUF4391 domain-containing protein n=1 Tax=Candidatus Coprovicinus avistercoris TaxID=2840754 RepID=A0A9D1HWX3_9ACTN|nr:DUF4391 domain-containing protein [Candidatus Coprovicinus avistercoris]
MPKKAFYEHLTVPSAIKEEIIRCIERIEIIASLKATSTHIPAGEKVAEIDVLGLYLRSSEGSYEVPYDAIDLIAKSVPNKQLFVCFVDDKVKLLVRRDRLYETAWQLCDKAVIELRGTNLDELWNSLSSQVVFADSEPADFVGRVERKNRIEVLQKELATVNKKRKNEKQIRRKNALFDRKRAIEAELSRLEGEL